VLIFSRNIDEVDATLLIDGIVFRSAILEIEEDLTDLRKPLRITLMEELLESSDLVLVATLVILLREVEDELD